MLASTASSALPSPQFEKPGGAVLAKLISHDKAFENTSTSVAASQMRNALNNLADTVADPEEKKVSFTSYCFWVHQS
jgi:UTP--glucose-1-phosphate uridylyltransferase